MTTPWRCRLLTQAIGGLLSLANLLCAAGPPPSTAATLQGEAAREQLRRNGQYESLQQAVATAQHRIEPDAAGRLRANSPAQRLQAVFAPDAAWLEHPEAGRFALVLTGTRQPAPPRLSGNRVTYQRGPHLEE